MSLTPMDHFLLDYYVKVVLPSMSTQCVMFQRVVRGSCLMPLDWVKLSLTDMGLLCGILLASCRYLCVVQHQEPRFMQLAIRYKLASMRQLNAIIMKEVSSFSDSTVANVLVLAIDEIALGDMNASRNHVLGALTMVKLNGGPQTLGLNGFLKFLLSKFVFNEGLFDSQPLPENGLLDRLNASS